MWLYLIALVLVIVGIAGGVFGGGIITIALVPIAVIIVISALVYGGMARSAAEKEGHGQGDASSRQPEPDPLPHHHEPASSDTLSTPEQLADERRVRQ